MQQKNSFPPQVLLPAIGVLAVVVLVVALQINSSPAAVVGDGPIREGSRRSSNTSPVVVTPPQGEEGTGEQTPPEEIPPEEMPPTEGEEGVHEAPPAPPDILPGGGATPVSSDPVSYDYPGCPDVRRYAGTHSDPFIPDFAFGITKRTIAPGSWTASSTWSDGRQPTATERVLITHRVTVPSGDHAVRSAVIQDGGVLAFDTDASARIRFVVTGGCGGLIVNPEGTLLVGTRTSPALGQINIVFADTPIDTFLDPAQYGNGLLGLGGRVIINGEDKGKTFVRQAGDVLAGATSMAVEDPVLGWKPGDTIALMDMRQLTWDQDRFADLRWDYATIRMITEGGRRIHFEEPLRFDHKCARPSFGAICPHVPNMTRNVVLESEGDGTRGHVLLHGHSVVELRNAAFNGLGRTRGGELMASTQFDSEGSPTRIGTNQIGRYSIHLHHLYGQPESPLEGGHQYIVEGNHVGHTSKWAITVHSSHYGLVKNNTMTKGAGAGLMTEVGNESGNVFEDNFAAGYYGFVDPSTFAVPGLPTGFMTGHTGDGFWFNGLNNKNEGLYAINNRWAGVHLWTYGHDGPFSFPTVPGVACHEEPSTCFLAERTYMSPDATLRRIESHANGGAGRTLFPGGFGIQGWSTPDLLITDYKAAFNAMASYNSVYGISVEINDWKVAGDPSKLGEPNNATIALGWGTHYGQNVRSRGCNFEGVPYSIHIASNVPTDSLHMRDCQSDSNVLYVGSLDGGDPVGVVELIDTNFVTFPLPTP